MTLRAAFSFERRRRRLATLTLNRPEQRNAWTAQPWVLRDAAERRSRRWPTRDDERARDRASPARARVLRRRRPRRRRARCFDAARWPAASARRAAAERSRRGTSAKPMIAAVNGVVAGIGATLPLHGTSGSPARATRIAFSFVKRGLVPDAGCTWLLPRLVGLAAPSDCCSPAARRRREALRLGLVIARRARRRAAAGARRRSRARSPADRAASRCAHASGCSGASPREPSTDGRRRRSTARSSAGRRSRRRQGRHPGVPGEAAAAWSMRPDSDLPDLDVQRKQVMETLGAFLDAVAGARAGARGGRLRAARPRDGAHDAGASCAPPAAPPRSKLVGARRRQGHARRLPLPEPPRVAADRLRRAAHRRRAGAVLDAVEARRDRLRPHARRRRRCSSRVPGFLKHDYLRARCARSCRSSRDVDAGRRCARRPRPALRRVVLLDGDGAGPASAGTICPTDVDDAFLDALEARVSPTDLATIFFTSGTTAQAKAVVHAHGALTTSARRIAECLGVTPDDAWWGHMPLFWSGGFILGALATLAGGGRIVLQESRRARQRAGAARSRALHDHGRLASGGAAARASRLRAAPPAPARRARTTRSATRLMGPDHHDDRRLRHVGDRDLRHRARAATIRSRSAPAPSAAPLAGMEIRIVDPETRRSRCRAGETGEILVKGPTLMEGYYRVPRAQTLRRRGLLPHRRPRLPRRRGQPALRRPHEGRHQDRRRERRRRRGRGGAGAPSRGAKRRTSSACRDPVRGENIAAFVVLRAGARRRRRRRCATFCRETLASYKVPRHVFVVDEAEVPRTGTGKVEKPALRRAAERRLQE